MPRHQRALRIAVTVLLASVPVSRAVAQAPSPRQAAAIDSFVQHTMREKRIPGVAVAVVNDGHTVYRKAFGVSNLETGSPLTPESVFELASITKQFTAGAIMLLAGDGKLSLDSAVAAYIDSAPPAWAGITVRHLLNHTSGIFAGGIVLHDGSPLQSVTTKQAFRQIAAARAFGPGRTGFYSDAGYFLAGLIIEKVSGQSYASFMRSRFFEPLGMANTTLTDRRRVIKGRVSTYEIVDGQHVNWRRDWDYELPSFFGIWSTLDDVAKWDNALRRATPLSRAMLDEMWSAGRLSDGRDALVDSRLYGLGFRLLDIRGHRVVSHTGASGTLLLHLLEEPLSVIVLTNLSNTAGRHGTSLGNGIVGLLRPGYRPVQLLQSGHDSNPELTRALQTLLADVSAGRESPTMTPAHAAHFRGRPPIARTEITRDLTGLGPLALISCDEVAGRGVRYTDPITRICYYRAVAAGRNSIFTFYLTQDSRVAHMRWAGEDEL